MATLTFKIAGEIYTTITQEVGTPVTAPTVDNPNFIDWGWQKVPSTMPSVDMTFNARFYQTQFIVDKLKYTPISLTHVEVKADSTEVLPSPLEIPDTVVCPDTGYEYKVGQIANYGFNYNASLNVVRLGRYVKRIGYYAFGQSSLTTLEMTASGENIAIDSNAFQYTNLTTYFMPARAGDLSISAFSQADKLEKAMLFSSQSIANSGWLFMNDSKLEEVLLPYGMTTLGDRMFYNNTSLHFLDVPPTVNELGDGIFYFCDITLNFYSETPPSIPSGKQPFTSATVKICAPAAYLPAYRTAWQNLDCDSITFEEMRALPYVNLNAKLFSNNKFQSGYSSVTIGSNVINGVRMQATGRFVFYPSFSDDVFAFQTIYMSSGSCQFVVDDMFGFYKFSIRLSTSINFSLSFSPSPTNVVEINESTRRYDFISQSPQTHISVNMSGTGSYINAYFNANRTTQKKLRFLDKDGQVISEEMVWPGDQIENVPEVPVVPHKKGYWEGLP